MLALRTLARQCARVPAAIRCMSTATEAGNEYCLWFARFLRFCISNRTFLSTQSSKVHSTSIHSRSNWAVPGTKSHQKERNWCCISGASPARQRRRKNGALFSQEPKAHPTWVSVVGRDSQLQGKRKHLNLHGCCHCHQTKGIRDYVHATKYCYESRCRAALCPVLSNVEEHQGPSTSW